MSTPDEEPTATEQALDAEQASTLNLYMPLRAPEPERVARFTRHPAVTETDRNSALIREFYAEVFNEGHVAFAERVHGPGYRYHDITVETGPVDHKTYMARNAGFAASFPDRKVDIEDLIATGDRVVARAVLHATHTGALGDVAPTGRPVRLASTIIYRFADGRVVEEWEIFDKLGMYQQLEVTPPALPDE